MCNNANGKTIFNIDNIGVNKEDDGAMMMQKVVRRTKEDGTTIIVNQNAREITNIEHLDTLTL